MKVQATSKREVRPSSKLTRDLYVGRSGSEEIYYCPYCIEIRGKPDDEGKLYFNRKKGIGFCQKCEVVVHDGTITTISIEAERYLSRRNVVEASQESVIDLSWTLAVSDVPEVARYLQKRRINSRSIERHGIRACRDPFLGVVLPDKDLGDLRTNFIQVRDIRDSTRVKYRGVSSTSKALYGASRTEGCSIGLVAEGVFSCISGSRIDPNRIASLCTYGKSIKSDQLEIMKTLTHLDEFILAYDGGYVGAIYKTASQMIQQLPSHKISIAFLPVGKDPNDVDDCELYEILTNRVTVDAPKLRIVMSMYNSSKSYEQFTNSLES